MIGLFDVFNKIIRSVPPEGTPVICESPASKEYAEPGIFINNKLSDKNKHKDISHLQALPHVMFKLEELDEIESIPVRFENGRWICYESELSLKSS